MVDSLVRPPDHSLFTRCDYQTLDFGQEPEAIGHYTPLDYMCDITPLPRRMPFPVVARGLDRLGLENRATAGYHVVARKHAMSASRREVAAI